MSELWLAGPVTSTAFGWRLERSDGVTLGFTTHDRDIAVNGVILRSSPGMLPTSIVETVDLEDDGLEVSGALSSAEIRVEDLASGRWDAARLEIFLFDWSDAAAGVRILAAGELGAVSHSGVLFEAELLGLKRLLNRPVVPQTSPGCRASFCDAACGLSRSRFRHVRSVASVDSEFVSLTTPVSAFDMAYGTVRFLDGPNSGLIIDVVANGPNGLTLARSPHFPVSAGSCVEVFEGCDKRLETCSGRFGNAINFRGEPHLPGNDLLTRYPGDG